MNRRKLSVLQFGQVAMPNGSLRKRSNSKLKIINFRVDKIL
jgi:hypothetical protein